jgi:hypothetical protein
MEVRWITAFIDRGTVGFEATVEFWSVITGSSLSAWRGGTDEFATLLPSDGSDAHLRVQRTGPGSSGSHIDLHVADVRAATDECVECGATIVSDNGGYVVFATPGGMAFCVVAHHGEHDRQRPVASASSGASTLVDQVSIDCDPDRFDDEVRFWSSITGWAPLAARAPEFVPLDRPVAVPLRIMLQRRSAAVGATSCHLDLACDDVAGAADEHSERGASVIERRENWTVMADPSGTAYCLTARRPDTGQLPAKPGLVTVEELEAAKAALIESMPGWESPAAYAVGVAPQDGPMRWVHTNHRGIHGFPAVALSKVLGHRTGSASIPMELRTFDAAIEVLRPAGACKHYEHPNLWAWEQLRATIDADGGLPAGSQIVAVFIGDEGDPVIDDFNRQLRAELGID